MSKSEWKTAITEIQPNQVRVRGYDIAQLMGRVTFGSVVYLVLRGELPDEKVGRLMDAILVSSVDHGATPPSTVAARTAASTGAELGPAVAAGILSINRHHGALILRLTAGSNSPSITLTHAAKSYAHFIAFCCQRGDRGTT